ncbi:hypothetical protein EST38_g8648 [Candolleomyces aberdarensis]|uniref:Uncharacterized protein n=1 Tax=Candolleomyces aberdarensis TaxID=2316362 RepID=A0A4Q2DE98_9AGAR|nr:hypothetical protein EST38_g8648 [Candolleomyces aberdarensis]
MDTTTESYSKGRCTQGSTKPQDLFEAPKATPPSPNPRTWWLRDGGLNERARANLNPEIPDILPVAQPEAAEANSGHEKAADAKPGTVELTARCMRTKWERQLDRITDEAGAEEDEEAGYPNEQHVTKKYWSGYDNQVYERQSYTRIRTKRYGVLQILLIPEQWLATHVENFVEANIMVGTHADWLIAEAVLKNVSGLTTHEDRELGRDAAWKDCSVASEGGRGSMGIGKRTVTAKHEEARPFIYNVPSKG